MFGKKKKTKNESIGDKVIKGIAENISPENAVITYILLQSQDNNISLSVNLTSMFSSSSSSIRLFSFLCINSSRYFFALVLSSSSVICDMITSNECVSYP